MQVNNSPRFIKSFMIGLIASSAGAFVALPSTAMPEPGEAISAADAIETVGEVAPIDAIVEPTAEEALPAPEETVMEADAEMTEEEAVAEEPALEEEAVMEADAEMTEEETVEAAEIEALDEAPVADEATEIEAPVADEATETEAPVADEATETEETVFAPTDDAFAELPEGAVEQLLLPENKDVLVQVLTYHVVPTEMLAADLSTGGVSTVEGSEIAVAVGDTITVDNANVVFPDLDASNGVIHVIDRVILPPAPEAEGEVETEAAE